MAEIASSKKVRFWAVETMKNLEKNAGRKGAIHHQLRNAANWDQALSWHSLHPTIKEAKEAR